MILVFSFFDIGALVFFITAWFIYHFIVESTKFGQDSLNARMNPYRHAWINVLLKREGRIVDTTLMASLQNGTAFFASTSLIAIGGALTLFKSTDEVLSLFAEMPLGLATTRLAWEIKVLGLAVIFVYAFFKFSWSYRIFNYAAILVGAVPAPLHANSSDLEIKHANSCAKRAADMVVVAGRHFNRGQRAFFFALAYLGWFISAYIFIITTAAVLVVMWRRQFASDARLALEPEKER